jgi:hypothetical protein
LAGGGFVLISTADAMNRSKKGRRKLLDQLSLSS